MPIKFAVTLAVIVAATAWSVACGGQAHAQSIFNTNLVVNGDAEQGLTGWSTAPLATDSNGQPFYFPLPIAVNYGSSLVYPTLTSPGPSNRGNALFVCQKSVFRSDQPAGGWLGTANQLIDVSAAAAQIDTGTVQMVLSAWTGGWGNKFDAATVMFNVVDGNGVSPPGLYNITNPPTFPPHRNFQTGLIYRSGTYYVPVGTRKISVGFTIQGQDASGGSPSPGTSAYVDNISVVLVP